MYSLSAVGPGFYSALNCAIYETAFYITNGYVYHLRKLLVNQKSGGKKNQISRTVGSEVNGAELPYSLPRAHAEPLSRNVWIGLIIEAREKEGGRRMSCYSWPEFLVNIIPDIDDRITPVGLDPC